MPKLPPVSSPAARLDQDLAARAVEKLKARQAPTAQEAAALKRFERDREEKLRWLYYTSIPQKHWREMSGRQAKVLKEQADRYGIPFGGPTVNLPLVVRATHDFLANNAQRLAAPDDPLMRGDGVSSPALERYREERAAIARLDRMEREGALISKDQTREFLGRVAAGLRSAGETLQRQFGTPALEVLYEALDDAQREIDRALGGQA